jgi:hypothetical protein
MEMNNTSKKSYYVPLPAFAAAAAAIFIFFLICLGTFFTVNAENYIQILSILHYRI